MDALKQHQRLARGQDIGVEDNETFGAQPHDHKNKPFNEPGVARKKHLHDGARSIREPAGYHPEPDHGPVE